MLGGLTKMKRGTGVKAADLMFFTPLISTSRMQRCPDARISSTAFLLQHKKCNIRMSEAKEISVNEPAHNHKHRRFQHFL